MAQTVIVGITALLIVGLLGSMIYAAYALASICEWDDHRPNPAFKGGREPS